MTNTLRVQRKFFINTSNGNTPLLRSNSVPNFIPDDIISPYSLFNNSFSISSTIIFDSAPIIVPNISVPAIVPSNVPASNVPAIVPSSSNVPPAPNIVPSSNSPSLIPNISSVPNVSNSLANSQNKNTQADSIVNLSKDDKIIKKSNKPKNYSYQQKESFTTKIQS
jgi:hypothetical protein